MAFSYDAPAESEQPLQPSDGGRMHASQRASNSATPNPSPDARDEPLTPQNRGEGHGTASLLMHRIVGRLSDTFDQVGDFVSGEWSLQASAHLSHDASSGV